MPEELRGELKAKLANLAPDARTRVEEALGKVIDVELAKGAKEFSKGVFFSRSRPSSLTGRLEDNQLIDKAVNLDDQAFAKFAQRLSSLKDLRG
jgi:hypothetical protein